MDLNGIMKELSDSKLVGLPKGTKTGYMHLQVSNLDDSEEFYVETLGFQHFTIYLKGEGYEQVKIKLDKYGYVYEDKGNKIYADDPSGNLIQIIFL